MADLSPVTLQDLRRQLNDPQHCHVETSPGRLLRHSKTADGPEPAFFEGEPIRFTKLAASRIVTQLRDQGCPKARTVMALCTCCNGKGSNGVRISER